MRINRPALKPVFLSTLWTRRSQVAPRYSAFVIGFNFDAPAAAHRAGIIERPRDESREEQAGDWRLEDKMRSGTGGRRL
jgi:hypothetical protein